MKKSLIFLLGFLVLSTAGASFTVAKKSISSDKGQKSLPKKPGKTSLSMGFGKVPIFFVPNRGQTDSRLNFYIQGKDKTIYFAPDGVTFALNYSDKPTDKKEVRSLLQHHPLDRSRDFGAWTFAVRDDPSTPSYDESLDTYILETRPVSVYCDNVNGKLRWTFRPIPEVFWVRVETKVGKKVTVTETWNENSMFRQIISNARASCNHRTFCFPFELVLERV